MKKSYHAKTKISQFSLDGNGVVVGATMSNVDFVMLAYKQSRREKGGNCWNGINDRQKIG